MWKIGTSRWWVPLFYLGGAAASWGLWQPQPPLDLVVVDNKSVDRNTLRSDRNQGLVAKRRSGERSQGFCWGPWRCFFCSVIFCHHPFARMILSGVVDGGSILGAKAAS